MTEPTREREDSLSQLSNRMREGFHHVDNVTWTVSSADAVDWIAEVESLEAERASIVKAAFEACVERVITWCQKNDGETLTDAIRVLTPESAILGAQIAELEARQNERAKFPPCDCTYSQLDPQGSIHLQKCERCLDLDSQISALQAKREGRKSE